ncbi:MAG: ATP-binding protein [Chloroflexi bacterium]|nr:ATP-binding protein [Chloroflexota bacterium]
MEKPGLGSVSLRVRMLSETIALVALVAAGTLLFDVIGTIVAGLIATAAVLMISLRLTEQFTELTEAVIRTTSIDRTHRLDPTGPAELARLARAVNRLVDRVGSEITEEAAERGRLASILNSMREGVVVVDDQGIIESANPAAGDMLGTVARVRPGMLLTSLTNHPDITRVVETAIETGEATRSDIELFDNSRTLMALATPLPDPGTESIRALLLLTDLTDIRRLDTTRREFVSNASHELRTPLTGIRAAAETLEQGAINDPENSAKFLQLIRDDVDRMDRLISEMLELSRLESGESVLEFESVDPAVLAEAALEHFQTIAEEAKVTVRSDVPADLPPVRVDKSMIDHVFTNLISNAIKWTRPGGEIIVTAWVDDDSMWFNVKDTGQGIEPLHLPHIFERFFKTDPARSRAGTGLGLSIARHIVEAHGGAISATSKPGVGSSFSFTVPISK